MNSFSLTLLPFFCEIFETAIYRGFLFLSIEILWQAEERFSQAAALGIDDTEKAAELSTFAGAVKCPEANGRKAESHLPPIAEPRAISIPSRRPMFWQAWVGPQHKICAMKKLLIGSSILIVVRSLRVPRRGTRSGNLGFLYAELRISRMPESTLRARAARSRKSTRPTKMASRYWTRPIGAGPVRLQKLLPEITPHCHADRGHGYRRKVPAQSDLTLTSTRGGSN